MEKTSEEWWRELASDLKIRLCDPDGWDRKNFDYSFNQEMITAKEFEKRLWVSTLQFDHEDFLILSDRIKNLYETKSQ